MVLDSTKFIRMLQGQIEQLENEYRRHDSAMLDYPDSSDGKAAQAEISALRGVLKAAELSQVPTTQEV